jgi:spermidine/putrescine transport system substrate-binding protein
MAEVMAQQGMIEKIDYTKVPNIQYLDTDYCHIEDYAPYSVPYLISFTGIGYLKDRIDPKDINWSIFKDPRYKWRTTLLNDFRETLGIGLIHLGLDPNISTEEELNSCVKELKIWKANIAKFENEQYKLGIDSGEFVLVHGYNGDIAQVMSENPNVAFALPEEGFTYSVDVFCIQKNCQKKELAHAFIDFMHRPQIATRNIVHTLYLCPNRASYKYLSPDLRANSALFIPKEEMKRAHLLVDLGPGNGIFLKAWDSLKSK